MYPYHLLASYLALKVKGSLDEYALVYPSVQGSYFISRNGSKSTQWNHCKKGNFVLMIVKEIPTEPPCSLPITVQVCAREEKINS